MSRQSLLLRARKAAELGMVDTCLIRRRVRDSDTTDDFSGVVEPTFQTLYEGKCRVQQHQASANQREVGEASLLLLQLEVQLPMSVVGLRAEDEVLLLTSLTDPDLPGRSFLVRDLAHKTDASARRVQVQERTS